ncbi:MAG: hypothetical protein ABI837_15670 [Acidobacteriota bacterium]
MLDRGAKLVTAERLGIRFVAGSAADVFGSQFASSAAAELRQRSPSLAASGAPPYHSDSLPPSGWGDLQRRVGNAVPQVSAMDPYQAVYAPGARPAIEALIIPGAADPLHVGSLDTLLEELRSFAVAAALPTDDLELMQLANKYLEDDELFERDLDVQTYVQLMLSARQAMARGDALWIAV